MSKNTENYRRSLYLSTAVLSSRQECTVEKVVNSFDGGIYVRRTYKEDKTEIFRLLAEIKSPYLPEIVEIFSGDGETVVIEKYIEGETLASAIANKKLTKTAAKNAARQLLCALDAIQKTGLVHRDIKPENIMLAEGKITLIDFGIARIYKENETRDTRHLGTEGYAAPEQYGFSQSDKRTDIYSAGKTILKMCEAAGLNGIVKKTALRCSQFDPQNRFEDAEAALKYLDKYAKEKSLAVFACCAVLLCLLSYAYSGFKPRHIPLLPVAETKQEVKQQQKNTEAEDSGQRKQKTAVEKRQTAGKNETKTVKTADNAEQVKATGMQDVINKSNAETAESAKTKAESKAVAEAEKTPLQADESKKQENTRTRAPQILPEEEYTEDEENPETEEQRERNTIFRGPGQNFTISYRGKFKSKKSAELNLGNGIHKKVSAKITETNLQLNIGGEKLTIPFGSSIKLYKSSSSLLEAVVKFCDLDKDGSKEIFAAVRSRHGYCVEQTALWFAKQINDKFVLCDAPLNCNSAGLFTLLPKFRILSDDSAGDAYRINGTKFEKVK